MGRHPTGARQYEIEKMWEHHEEICRLLLCGMQPKDIAPIVGMTPQHISTIRNSKIFQDKMEIMRAARDASSVDVARRIQEIAPMALERLEEVISDPVKYDEKLVVSTSQDMLDRAGHGKVSKFQGAVAHLTAEDIRRMKADAIRVGIENGDIEQVDYEDMEEEHEPSETAEARG